MLEVNGSVLKLKEGIFANYEENQLLQFKLMATDPKGSSYEQEFNINVLDDLSDNENLNNGQLKIEFLNYGFDAITNKNFVEWEVSGDWGNYDRLAIGFTNPLVDHDGLSAVVI